MRTNYEKPDGWSVGQPEVLVAESVIDRHGMPVVNYDSIEQLLVDDFAIPRPDKQSVEIYGRHISSVRGWTATFSNTIHINAFKTESFSSPSKGTMAILAHEVKHQSDARNHKTREVAEGLLRLSTMLGGAWLTREYSTHNIALDILGGLAGGQLYSQFDIAEVRAYRAAKKIPDSPHETDILFPKSARTMRLSLEGRVPQELMGQLGIEHTAGNFAFNWPDNPPGGLRHEIQCKSRDETDVNSVALNGGTIYVKHQEPAGA